MSIYLIAGIVCAIAIAGYFIRLFRDGRRERRRIREFQQDIAMQERARYEKEEWLRPYPSAPDDDMTLILPVEKLSDSAIKSAGDRIYAEVQRQARRRGE